MALWLWIIIIVVGLIVIWIIAMYNTLIVLRNRIKNAWSQIDVQLKRRADLIPNLINTVKGYVKHERGTFEAITKARTALMAAKDVKGKAKAENQLAGALKTLFAVAENYPQLKANENFKMLQEELSGTESKIAYSRQFYNDSVLRLNNSVQKFPTNIIANMFNFKQREFFEVKGKEREAVKVEF